MHNPYQILLRQHLITEYLIWKKEHVHPLIKFLIYNRVLLALIVVPRTVLRRRGNSVYIALTVAEIWAVGLPLPGLMTYNVGLFIFQHFAMTFNF